MAVGKHALMNRWHSTLAVPGSSIRSRDRLYCRTVIASPQPQLREEIERLYELKADAKLDTARRIFAEFRDALTAGRIRAAEKTNHSWQVNAWVKKGILLGFRIGELAETGEALS